MKLTRLTKKGQAIGLNSLLPIGIVFIVLAIALGLGAMVLSEIQADQTADTVAYNSTAYGLTSLETISKWMPTIALVVVSAVIIGIVVLFLASRARR